MAMRLKINCEVDNGSPACLCGRDVLAKGQNWAPAKCHVGSTENPPRNSEWKVKKYPLSSVGDAWTPQQSWGPDLPSPGLALALLQWGFGSCSLSGPCDSLWECHQVAVPQSSAQGPVAVVYSYLTILSNNLWVCIWKGKGPASRWKEPGKNMLNSNPRLRATV